MATEVNNTGVFPAPKTTVPQAIASYSFVGTSAVTFGDAAGYLLPVNGVASLELVWTKASGTLLTVTPFVSLDGTTFQPLPSYAAAIAGVSVASPASVTFASATWLRSGSSTIVDCPVSFNCGGWAWVLFKVASNNASGSITGNVGAGVQS